MARTEAQREATRRFKQHHPEKVRADKLRWAAKPESKEKSRLRTARHIAELRDQLFERYGRECVCCGEQHVEFLTFDHPGDDGAARRREHGGAHQEWRAVRRAGFPTGYYEVRCYNCNCARYRHGICPHERERLAQEAA